MITPQENGRREREGRMLIFINHVFLRLPFAARSIASGSAAEGEAGVRRGVHTALNPFQSMGPLRFDCTSFDEVSRQCVRDGEQGAPSVGAGFDAVLVLFLARAEYATLAPSRVGHSSALAPRARGTDAVSPRSTQPCRRPSSPALFLVVLQLGSSLVPPGRCGSRRPCDSSTGTVRPRCSSSARFSRAVSRGIFRFAASRARGEPLARRSAGASGKRCGPHNTVLKVSGLAYCIVC